MSLRLNNLQDMNERRFTKLTDSLDRDRNPIASWLPRAPVTVVSAPVMPPQQWHAGGGGSREKLSDLQEGLTTLPLAPPLTMEEMIKKYWLYGVVAVVGLSVLQKL